jgi:hypothetical protein
MVIKKSLYFIILGLMILFMFSTIFLSNSSNVGLNLTLMLLQLACLFVASLTLRMSKKLLIGSIILIGTPLVLISTFHMLFISSVKVLASLFVGGYFLLLSFEILSQIVHSEEVDLHILSGLISSFLMIGVAFASIYLSVYRLDNMAFSGVSPSNHAPWLDMIYFSFATITTVGWGDITAVNQFAKVIAILQSIVGLIFNAIVISRFANVFWFKKKK